MRLALLLPLAMGLGLLAVTGCGLLDPHAHVADIKPVWKIEDPEGWGGYGPLNLVGDMAITSYPYSPWVIGIDLKDRRFIWRHSNYVNWWRFISTKDGYFYTHEGYKGQNVPYRLWVARVDTGELVREVALPNSSGIDSSANYPIVSGTKLFVVSEEVLVSYDITDAADPKELWRVQLIGGPTIMRVDPDGDVYVGFSDRGSEEWRRNASLYKYSGEDGHLIWKAFTKYSDLDRPGDVKSWYEGTESIGFDGDRVIVSAGATLQAFDRRTGERLWVSPEVQCGGVVEGGFGGPIEFGGGKAYLLRNSNVCFHAFNLSDGSIAWIVDAGQVAPWAKVTFGAANQKALYHNGVVYASNEHLWAVDAATGKVLAVSRTRAYQATSTAPILYNGEIIVNGNPIYAYKPLR